MGVYKLKGHETFVLREGWLQKGLRAVSMDPEVFTDPLRAETLGIGTNMVSSLRYWLRTAGLIIDRPGKGTFLTDVGKIIYDNDPYFEDLFSLWIVHANIARNYTMATSWNVFFNEMDLTEFTREELISLMTRLLTEKTGKAALSARSIRDDCSAILNMYCKPEMNPEKMYDPEDNARESPFAELGLLSRHGDVYEKKRPSVETLSPYLILYMIADSLNETKSLSITEVEKGDDMPGRMLNLNRLNIIESLSRLSNKDLITINLTAGLDTIYSARTYSAREILGYYYERT